MRITFKILTSFILNPLPPVVTALISISPSSSSLSPQPQEALEDSTQLSEGFGLEEGDLGADSLEWCERSIGGGDTSDEYFDSHSWHSDTLSDLSPDAEDSLDALLGLEETCVGRRATCDGFHVGQSKARRRESVLTKDGQRDVTETYVGLSNSNRRKSPERPVDPDIPLKFSTRELCLTEIRPHTETLKLDLHQEQSRLEAVCTDTEVINSTELCSLNVKSQHKTDTFDTKVTTPSDTQEVKEKLQTQLEESNPIILTESTNSETCTVHIDTTKDKTVETQQWKSTHQHETRLQTGNIDRKHVKSTDRQRLGICDVQDVEVENIELLSTYFIEKNPGSHSDCNDRHHIQRENVAHQGTISEDREIQAITEQSKDKGDLCKSVGTYCNGTHHKIEGKDSICIDTHLTDVINAQTSDSNCTPAHSKFETKYADSQLITEFVVGPNITEVHGPQTNSVSHTKKSEFRETLDTQINVLAHKVDICCSQTLGEESPNRGLSEIHPQVCTSVTKPQEKGWVSGVCFQAEQCGCVGTTTERTKPLGTVNEICSSITFSTGTTAYFPLDTCTTELTVVPNVSKLALPVPLADPDRVELNETQPDQKQPQCARLQPWQILCQTKDSIPNHFDEGDATIEKSTHRQFYSVDKLLERAQSDSVEPDSKSDSTHIQSDTGKGSEECLPHHPFSNSLLFFSSNRGVEDSSPLLSENLRGEWRAGSPCTVLRQNKEQKGEGSHVYLDQQQDVEALSKVNLVQSQLGTTKLSEQRVIHKAFASDRDAYCTQHVPNKIGKTSTCPADTDSIQDSSTDHPGVAQEAISSTNIETIVSTISSLCKQVQREPKIPESLCGLKASASLLSDSNNNTKASIKGVEKGEGQGCFLGGAQSNLENSEKIICHLVTPSTKVTSDPLEDVDKPQEDSEVFLSSLYYRANWSCNDSESGLGLDNHCHLSLAQADELGKLKTEKSIEENTVADSLDSKCSNSEINEGLKHLVSEKIGLLVDSEFKEERHYCSQPGDHSLPNRRRNSSSESLDEYTLAEECREHIQVNVPAPQQEVRVVRYSQPDVSLNLLSISSLETILEADRSLENCCTAEDDLKVETKKEHEITRPSEEVRDIVNLSGDITSPKSPQLLPEQEKESLTTAELEPELKPATPVLRSTGERCCRPMSVAYDAVSYTSASSNFDEMDDPQFTISDRNANPDKITKRSKTKGNQTGNKGCKFSVFTKMPSFRKAKGSKGAKDEEVPQELSTGEGENILPEQGPQGDSDDEVFVKGDILNQTVHQAFSSVRYEIEEEASTPHTRHVRQLVSQGSSGEGDGGPSTDNPLFRQVQSPNVQTYKRSKSNDSLNIRMRFAQAHKSLSSLFESRSMDKENEEQANVGIDGDAGKTKQSWRKLKKAREAELLKRTMSVPDGECSKTASGQDYGELMSTPLLDRLSNPGSPSSLRALRHTDPISKRGVPQGSGKENPHGCKSEGQRRKLSPNGLPITPGVPGLPPFLDCSAVPQPNHTSPVSPLSPCSLATLTHQHLPSWTRSHPVANEGLAESPLRPMSPKPNSPRPAVQRKVFRYPHSTRASSVSPILLGQSVSVEGLTDPPERPKTLKPSASPLGLSLSPLDAAEGKVDSQSHISLYAIGSINELEVRKSQFVMHRAYYCNMQKENCSLKEHLHT